MCARVARPAWVPGPSTSPLDASMEYRASVPRTLGLAGLAVGMILGSFYIARNYGESAEAVGWTGAVFFTLCLIAILFQLFRRVPTVVIDDLGVLDRRMRIGRISWDDISSVSVQQVRSTHFVSLWLRNEEQYLSHSPNGMRILGRINREMGFSPFSMSFVGLTPGWDDAYARISARISVRAGV